MYHACLCIWDSVRLSEFNACMDCTEAVFVGFSVTSERSYRIDVLMFSSVFDERAISAQATSPPIIIATAHTVWETSLRVGTVVVDGGGGAGLWRPGRRRRPKSCSLSLWRVSPAHPARGHLARHHRRCWLAVAVTLCKISRLSAMQRIPAAPCESVQGAADSSESRSDLVHIA